eukprot:13528008-Alexandrium_andersonii.AAC.1
MEVCDFRRFRAADRAVWPVGHAGTAAASGWILGPELTVTRGLNGCKGAQTYIGLGHMDNSTRTRAHSA